MRFLAFFFDEVDFVQTQNLAPGELWWFLPVGYLVTILIETPILVFGLPSKLTLHQKLLCGVWLTACTYPTIFFGMPRWQYLLVAETFAPVAECAIFWLAFRSKKLLQGGDWIRAFVAIVVANLASFGIGEVFNYTGWFGLF